MSDMSMEMASERICYVHCNLCSTILAVSVPCSSMLMTMVTVRCGHCGNHLLLNMPALHPPHLLQHPTTGSEELKGKSNSNGSSSSSLAANAALSFESAQHPPPPLGKRKRVPSVYNKFIKEEIQRIKARNPKISHREAFSLAAKNWAHFPRIHFGSVTLEGAQKQPNKLDLPSAGEETHFNSL